MVCLFLVKLNAMCNLIFTSLICLREPQVLYSEPSSKKEKKRGLLLVQSPSCVLAGHVDFHFALLPQVFHWGVALVTWELRAQ